jgi:hypothetical protein
MTDDPKRYVVITPERLEVGPGPGGDLVINLLNPEQDMGLLGVGLILRCSPNEAREFAKLILRKADETEALASRREN